VNKGDRRFNILREVRVINIIIFATIFSVFIEEIQLMFVCISRSSFGNAIWNVHYWTGRWSSEFDMSLLGLAAT